MILNKSQAEAVYSAMCALNNVGGYCNELMVGKHDAIVVSYEDGRVVVFGDAIERYSDQSAFASAYGLQHG